MVLALNEEPVGENHTKDTPARHRGGRHASFRTLGKEGGAGQSTDDGARPKGIYVTCGDVVPGVARIKQSHGIADDSRSKDRRDLRPIRFAGVVAKKVGAAASLATNGDSDSIADEGAEIGAEAGGDSVGLGPSARDAKAESGSHQSTDECARRLSARVGLEDVHRRQAGQRAVVAHVEGEVALRA